MIVVENLQDEFKYGNVVLSTALSLAAEWQVCKTLKMHFN